MGSGSGAAWGMSDPDLGLWAGVGGALGPLGVLCAAKEGGWSPHTGTWWSPLPWPRAAGQHDTLSPLRLLSPRPSLLTPTGDTRAHASPQKPLDLKQLKQRAAAIPPIVSAGPPPAASRPQPPGPARVLPSAAGAAHLRPPCPSLLAPLAAPASWRNPGRGGGSSPGRGSGAQGAGCGFPPVLLPSSL